MKRVSLEDQTEPVVVRSVDDAAELPLGSAYVVEFDDEPEPPIEYDEAFHPLDSAISEAIDKALNDRGNNAADPPGRSEPTGNEKPAGGQSDGLSVVFDDGAVLITSVETRTVQLSGDLRDGKAKLVANRPSRRELTAEGNGFISIDGERWPTP